MLKCLILLNILRIHRRPDIQAHFGSKGGPDRLDLKTSINFLTTDWCEEHFETIITFKT